MRAELEKALAKTSAALVLEHRRQGGGTAAGGDEEVDSEKEGHDPKIAEVVEKVKQLTSGENRLMACLERCNRLIEYRRMEQLRPGEVRFFKNMCEFEVGVGLNILGGIDGVGGVEERRQ